jgi:hypothetical protein
MRSKAAELESIVLAAIEALLADRERIRSALLATGRRGANLDRASAGCEAASRRLATALLDQKIAILAALIARIEISRDRLKIILRIAEIERFLRWDGLDFFEAGRHPKRSRQPTYLLDVAASGVRLSRRLQLPVEPRDPTSNAKPDRRLLLLLQQVRRAQRLIDTEREQPVAALAKRMSRNTGHFMKLLRLNYLAPDIITAILDGVQPSKLTRRQLLDADFPTDWPTQRKLFGFPDQPPLKTCERF